jgi:hypothetical protein
VEGAVGGAAGVVVEAAVLRFRVSGDGGSSIAGGYTRGRSGMVAVPVVVRPAAEARRHSRAADRAGLDPGGRRRGKKKAGIMVARRRRRPGLWRMRWRWEEEVGKERTASGERRWGGGTV